MIHRKDTRLPCYRPTGDPSYRRHMFEVTLLNDCVELVDGADSFQQEGPLTTFFASGGRHRGLDAWSLKLASFRTDRIVKIVRCSESGARELDHELRTFASAL
jgi:hypothetical protein